MLQVQVREYEPSTLAPPSQIPPLGVPPSGVARDGVLLNPNPHYDDYVLGARAAEATCWALSSGSSVRVRSFHLEAFFS